MKKRRIIYSLSERGLFSEISNLALAIVYAKYNNEKLIVNTRNWNARIEKGWEDYFEPTLPCCNDIMCSQFRITTKEKIWIGNIYYNPPAFFRFYFYFIVNKIFLLFHPRTELTKDVFVKIRMANFIENHKNIKADYSLILKCIMKFNVNTTNYIKCQKEKMNLPQNYIGVHIRRGDKITSGEMSEINLDKYIYAIKEKGFISRNIFIATDDISVVEYIKSVLKKEGFNIYNNINVTHSGFDEGIFNKKDKKNRYIDTLNMLLDMDILVHSLFFIGTYSSNVSRIIPLYIGFENALSLDEDWAV